MVHELLQVEVDGKPHPLAASRNPNLTFLVIGIVIMYMYQV